jgi:hypothetical protein
MSQDGFAEDTEDTDEISPFDTSVARQARIYNRSLIRPATSTPIRSPR